MHAQAAISGSASYFHSGSDGYDEAVAYGNLAVLDGMPICIECGIDVRLNLVGLAYAATGVSTLNPHDGRGLLLEYREFYDYFSGPPTCY